MYFHNRRKRGYDTALCQVEAPKRVFDLVRTSIYEKYSGSMKIATRLDHIRNRKTASGANWSKRRTYRLFIINTRPNEIPHPQVSSGPIHMRSFIFIGLLQSKTHSSRLSESRHGSIRPELTASPERRPKLCSEAETPKVDHEPRLGLLKLQALVLGGPGKVNRHSFRAPFGLPQRACGTARSVPILSPCPFRGVCVHTRDR